MTNTVKNTYKLMYGAAREFRNTGRLSIYTRIKLGGADCDVERDEFPELGIYFITPSHDCISFFVYDDGDMHFVSYDHGLFVMKKGRA